MSSYPSPAPESTYKVHRWPIKPTVLLARVLVEHLHLQNFHVSMLSTRQHITPSLPSPSTLVIVDKMYLFVYVCVLLCTCIWPYGHRSSSRRTAVLMCQCTSQSCLDLKCQLNIHSRTICCVTECLCVCHVSMLLLIQLCQKRNDPTHETYGRACTLHHAFGAGSRWMATGQAHEESRQGEASQS